METLVTFRELSDAYRGKRVFITGHTGFKGAWLMAVLHLAGAGIKGYALAPEYENGLFDILGPLPGVDSCLADIRDKDRLKAEMLAFQPDYVFHLAAQPLVRRSYEMPADTFDINVTGTAHVLEAVMALEKPCSVVAVTTDKVYENKETGVLYKESDALGGHDPYSASKACAELVISSFRNCFFSPSTSRGLASARAGNVIGGGDWSRDRIIPDTARSLLSGRTIEVRNPVSVRPWQHVLEPLGGYLRLAILLHRDARRYAKAYNFGPLPQDHLSVKDLVETAIATWGQGAWKDISSAEAPHEAGLLKLDITMAREELYWTPRLDARQAIQWALEWYRQPVGRQAEYTFQQIKSYFPA
ncbi:CDP-glucose 4,6-dehydratase [Puia dinghuensis]|uniref:CDP-glucose 4,6-dehydratase n=1 Tax=Puia dinghuensis TaxID=1792502 RepID=A0A8J2U8C6_9BACT|nr:CDP-glucose 4,6-dehydratase [Puia dinghuensis]GGA86342.1 CDP-glucose 4,6-dehydratase [Puia dinghuensis]